MKLYVIGRKYIGIIKFPIILLLKILLKFRLKDTKDVRWRNFNVKLLYDIVSVKYYFISGNCQQTTKCDHVIQKKILCMPSCFVKRSKIIFWSWLESTIRSLKKEYKLFKMDFCTLIYGFNVQNRHFKLLDFILNCALFLRLLFINASWVEILKTRSVIVTKYHLVVSRIKKSDLYWCQSTVC